MSLKRLTVAVMLSVCSFAVHATAQKNELSALVGRTFISDQVITTSTFSDNKLRFGDGLTLDQAKQQATLPEKYKAFAFQNFATPNVEDMYKELTGTKQTK